AVVLPVAVVAVLQEHDVFVQVERDRAVKRIAVARHVVPLDGSPRGRSDVGELAQQLVCEDIVRQVAAAGRDDYIGRVHAAEGRGRAGDLDQDVPTGLRTRVVDVAHVPPAPDLLRAV